jgi:hypothetical protein
MTAGPRVERHEGGWEYDRDAVGMSWRVSSFSAGCCTWQSERFGDAADAEAMLAWHLRSEHGVTWPVGASGGSS